MRLGLRFLLTLRGCTWKLVPTGVKDGDLGQASAHLPSSSLSPPFPSLLQTESIKGVPHLSFKNPPELTEWFLCTVVKELRILEQADSDIGNSWPEIKGERPFLLASPN